jgi:hypothetical protein
VAQNSWKGNVVWCGRHLVLLLIGSGLLVACSTTSGSAHRGEIVRATREIRFELVQNATCEKAAGSSPAGICSRGFYSGGLEGIG